MKEIANGILIVLIAFIFLSGWASSSNSSSNSSKETINIAGDLIVDAILKEFQYKEVNVKGDVIATNGGELVLSNSVLNIISSVD